MIELHLYSSDLNSHAIGVPIEQIRQQHLRHTMQDYELAHKVVLHLGDDERVLKDRKLSGVYKVVMRPALLTYDSVGLYVTALKKDLQNDPGHVP